MPPSFRRGPTTTQGIVLLVAGVAIAAPGLEALTSAFTTQSQAPWMPLIALIVGAILFAIGIMVTLVALMRPAFEKREVDEIVDKMTRR